MKDNICAMCGAELPTECGKRYCEECVERVEKAEIKELVKIANEVANDKKALFDELFFVIPCYDVTKDSIFIVVQSYARIGKIICDPVEAIVFSSIGYSKDSFRKLIEKKVDELYKGIKEYNEKGE